MNQPLSQSDIQPSVILSPIKSAVPAQGGVIEVMVRVQAPDQPVQPEGAKAKITQKRLALVVDRSGSMDGQPLVEALKCVEHIANSLTPQDQMSVVVYDHDVDVLVPLALMQSADAIKSAIAGVQSGGSTNLFGGWEQGAKQLEKGLESSISRVILLSDGQANHGLLEMDAIEQHCRDWLSKGVTTTTVGLGRGFNEDLMIAMARAGGGQQYYGQTAADLYDSFDEEFSLLDALCLRQLDLKLIPAPGVIVEPLGIVQQNADGTYRLSDLAWGSEAGLMLRLHVNPRTGGAPRDLLVASIQGIGLDGQIVVAHASMLSLPCVEAAALSLLPVDEVVQRRLQEIEFGQSSQALRKLVQDGDVQGVRTLMKGLEKRFGQNPWLQAKLERLREMAERDPEMMVKEVRFSMMKMNTRLSAKVDAVFDGDETNLQIPAFLRKKTEEGKGRKSPSSTLNPKN